MYKFAKDYAETTKDKYVDHYEKLNENTQYLDFKCKAQNTVSGFWNNIKSKIN